VAVIFFPPLSPPYKGALPLVVASTRPLRDYSATKGYRQHWRTDWGNYHRQEEEEEEEEEGEEEEVQPQEGLS
jgi:hypothetical protein